MLLMKNIYVSFELSQFHSYSCATLKFQVSLSLWDTSEACGADYRDEQVNLVERYFHDLFSSKPDKGGG